MNIQCESCSTVHELDPPAWVVSSGRAFRFRCSACGHSQSVLPQGAIGAARGGAGPRSRAPSVAPPALLDSSPPAVDDPAAAGPADVAPHTDVYLKQNGQIYVVRDWATLKRWITERRIDENDLVSEGGVRWEPVGSRPELSALFEPTEEPRRDPMPSLAPSRPNAPSRPPTHSFPFSADTPFGAGGAVEVWTDEDTEGVPVGLPPLPTEETAATPRPAHRAGAPSPAAASSAGSVVPVVPAMPALTASALPGGQVRYEPTIDEDEDGDELPEDDTDESPAPRTATPIPPALARPAADRSEGGAGPPWHPSDRSTPAHPAPRDPPPVPPALSATVTPAEIAVERTPPPTPTRLTPVQPLRTAAPDEARRASEAPTQPPTAEPPDAEPLDAERSPAEPPRTAAPSPSSTASTAAAPGSSASRSPHSIVPAPAPIGRPAPRTLPPASVPAAVTGAVTSASDSGSSAVSGFSGDFFDNEWADTGPRRARLGRVALGIAALLTMTAVGAFVVLVAIPQLGESGRSPGLAPGPDGPAPAPGRASAATAAVSAPTPDPAPAADPSTEPDPEAEVVPASVEPEPPAAVPPPPEDESLAKLLERAWSKADDDRKAAGLMFKKALELEPDNDEAHYGYGYVLLMQGDKDEAARELCAARDARESDIRQDVNGMIQTHDLRCP